MQIVIDIPQYMYDDIKNGTDGYNNYICSAIRNGTPEFDFLQLIIEISKGDYEKIKGGHVPFSVLSALQNATLLDASTGRK